MTSINGWKAGEKHSKFVRKAFHVSGYGYLGFPTGPISANTWNFKK
jgi:hypothetical protein